MKERKPHGYWNEQKNIRTELKIVISKLGYFPIGRDLEKMKKSSLSSGIVKTGGFTKWRMEFGYEELKKPRGYWENPKNVKSELKEVISKLGHFPVQKELKKMKKSSLSLGMNNTGGKQYWAEEFGYTPARKDNYWQDKKNGLAEAKRVMEENKLDRLPSSPELRKMGESDLDNAITRYYQGYNKFREKLGQELIQIENGKWPRFDYTKNYTKHLIKKYGFKTMPTQNQLENIGEYGLVNAINTYHKGFRDFGIKLGFKPKRRKIGAWKDLSYTMEHARYLMKKYRLETLPSNNWLGDKGEGSFANAIINYHHGFPHFRQLLHERLGIKTQKQELLEDLIGYARQ